MDLLIPRIIDRALAIQQIPAPTFHEAARAEYVRACFESEGLEQVDCDPAGNVFGCLKSRPAERIAALPPLLVCAHLDTVFPAGTDLRTTREAERLLGPGIGDNSLGVAGLFGLLWALRARGQVLPGDLWLVANVCEEGLGDLRGIRAVLDRFQPPASPRRGKGTAPLACIILEGMSLGQVYHRGLGVRRFRISVNTPGGHSWIDFGQPSAVHELAALSTRITALDLPPAPRTTLNIGVISGGSSVNTIAATAMLELDLRSVSAEVLQALAGQVEGLVRQACKPGVEVVIETIGQRPAGDLAADHPLVCLARQCLLAVGIEPHLNIGSTDANLPLSRGIPAVTIGLTTGGRAHTLQEYINLPPLEKGLEQLLRLVCAAWEILPGS